MKSEALKALLEMARKRMAEEGDEASMEGESVATEAVENAIGEPEETSVEVMAEEDSPDLKELLEFLKAKAVKPSSSEVARMVNKGDKPKGSHLFKKQNKA